MLVLICFSLLACQSQEEIAAQQRAQEEARVTRLAHDKAERDRAFEEQLQRDIRRKEAGLPPERPIEDRQREERTSDGKTVAIVGAAAVLGGAYVLGKMLKNKRR